MEYDFNKIEKKWQERWEKEKIFEPKIEKKKKFFATFPYPYINLSPHIGHFYTLMRVEAFSRYKRLRGFNVLFPQAWHCTGSPIVAAANRVKEGESKQIKLLKEEGFSDTEIKEFSKPEHWIAVFREKWIRDLKAMGLSIDWRRNFITTSLNPSYDKFVRWQFRKLMEKGYIEKGKHPVVWDPKTNMPVGDHDRIKGEGEVPQEFCLFKFSLNDGKKLVSATLRPDTVMGITNVYVNPKVTYVMAEVNDEIWIISKTIIEKLKNQGFNIGDNSEDINGKDLVGKYVEFFKGKKIPVLPADFLDPNYGTGIVHSVPSDSADDLIALRDLQANKHLIKEYSLNSEEIRKIKPISIFKTPGIKGDSAQYFLDKYKVKNSNEKEKLEEIRKELYKLTYHKSIFGPLYKKGFLQNLEGMPVSKGQEIVKADLLKEGKINLFYELTGSVVSRSLTECIVKIVSDQWFIKYGDKKWKKEVHGALRNLKLYPEIVREQFDYVIDWLNDWACTREYGLGTRFPFDEKWLIESLSDSTIYMAYYTIAHLIKKLKISEVNDDFFDYVFLGKGKGKKDWEKLKAEFEYWYPLDFRNSGKDLVQNHLTFFLFNHVAIFPQKYWPKSIGVNGWVRVEGEKMSKSLGNVIPIKEMKEKYGADISRLTILNGGESLEDPNWDSNFAKSLAPKFEQIGEIILQNYKKGGKEIRDVDKWADSVLNKNILEITGLMEETLFRSAIQRIFFNIGNLIKDYSAKTKNPNKEIFKKIVDSYLVMLSPFAPHFCEELWEKIGNKGFVSLSEWPISDEKKINEKFEQQNKQVVGIIEDINNILKIVGTKNKVFIYTIPNEKALYSESEDLIKKKTNLDLMIFAVNDKEKYDPQEKSKRAKLGKPAIYLE